MALKKTPIKKSSGKSRRYTREMAVLRKGKNGKKRLNLQIFSLITIMSLFFIKRRDSITVNR